MTASIIRTFVSLVVAQALVACSGSPDTTNLRSDEDDGVLRDGDEIAVESLIDRAALGLNEKMPSEATIKLVCDKQEITLEAGKPSSAKLRAPFYCASMYLLAFKYGDKAFPITSDFDHNYVDLRGIGNSEFQVDEYVGADRNYAIIKPKLPGISSVSYRRGDIMQIDLVVDYYEQRQSCGAFLDGLPTAPAEPCVVGSFKWEPKVVTPSVSIYAVKGSPIEASITNVRPVDNADDSTPTTAKATLTVTCAGCLILRAAGSEDMGDGEGSLTITKEIDMAVSAKGDQLIATYELGAWGEVHGGDGDIAVQWISGKVAFVSEPPTE